MHLFNSCSNFFQVNGVIIPILQMWKLGHRDHDMPKDHVVSLPEQGYKSKHYGLVCIV